MKKVSIILPTHNGERFIKESIESVINQTYKNWELIIINDASNDNTLEIINQYANIDRRIKVYTNDNNMKLPASLNIGFSHAKGEYYTWTSDDNLYMPTAIEKMVKYLNTHLTCDLISYDYEYIDENNYFEEIYSDTLGKDRTTLQLTYLNNVGSCFMYRKEIANTVGKYDEEMFCMEDYDFWCRIALKGNIHYQNEILYKHRRHSSSLSSTKREVILKKDKIVRNKYALKIMDKLGLSNKEKINMLLFYYKYDKKTDIAWLEQAKKINTVLYYRCKLKKMIKSFIFYKLRKFGINISLGKGHLKSRKTNYVRNYKLAKQWIEKYTIDNKGIVVESSQPNTIYPEVTGYFIPTLIKFGDKQRAINFGNYLITIQNENGSWNEASGNHPYTFDTGMILKGLAALIETGLDNEDKYKNSLLKGVDYILSMQKEDGSISTEDYSCWGLPYNKSIPEAIHLYCLEPVRYAGRITGDVKYENFIKKALDYYLSDETLTDFNTLSHFNAYIIEALIDIGEIKRAQRAMDLISTYQRLDGSISAYSNVDFVCSTGLFQYAICWYKLGEYEKADKAFDYACKLQNKSGGWYGSYTVGRDSANYLPNGEISWGVKFFLDAIYYRQIEKYKLIKWSKHWRSIDTEEKRYQIIEDEIKDDKYAKILDLGCAYARYTKNLVKKYPAKSFYCVDIIDNNFKYIDFAKEAKVGSALNIPYKNEYFDAIFLTESLEHAIDTENSINEISRVLKPGGKVIIIDKDIKYFKKVEVDDMEQYFNEKELCTLMKNASLKTKVIKDIPYEGQKSNGFFKAWIGCKKR